MGKVYKLDQSENLDYDDDWMVDPDSDRYYERRDDRAMTRVLWGIVLLVMVLFGSLIVTAGP